jgi:hypothetical protein
MGLYLESGYIDQERILSSADNFIFEIGARGTGKSYGILKYIIDHNVKFMMLRRTQTEADMISTAVTNPFKALMMDNPKLEITVESISKNLSCFTIPGETKEDPRIRIGYLGALSTFATIRGADLSDVDVIFYDEFIPEKHQRPIKDEYAALMNVYETVNRNRELQGRQPVKMISAANSNDLANPIFIGLEIVDRIARMMKKGIEVYKDPEKSLAVYMFMKSPISDQKAKTSLYKLTAGNDFQNMALRNMFDLDTRYIRSRSLKEYKPVVKIGELVIYEHKSRKEYYARCGASGTIPHVFTTTDIDKKRFVKTYNYLFLRYLSGYMLFESSISQVLFEKLFS